MRLRGVAQAAVFGALFVAGTARASSLHLDIQMANRIDMATSMEAVNGSPEDLRSAQTSTAEARIAALNAQGALRVAPSARVFDDSATLYAAGALRRNTVGAATVAAAIEDILVDVNSSGAYGMRYAYGQLTSGSLGEGPDVGLAFVRWSRINGSPFRTRGPGADQAQNAIANLRAFGAFDRYSVEQAPEPSTLVLLSLGLGAVLIGAARRRRSGVKD